MSGSSWSALNPLDARVLWATDPLAVRRVERVARLAGCSEEIARSSLRRLVGRDAWLEPTAAVRADGCVLVGATLRWSTSREARSQSSRYAASVRGIMPLAGTDGSEDPAVVRGDVPMIVEETGMEGQRLRVTSDRGGMILWTVSERSGMARRARDGKARELAGSRTLNPRPEAVVDETFRSSEFFDARIWCR